MAKVSKSVKEKRKDFAKTKLKVGKTKAAPSNATDTSFRAKAIALPKQSVTVEAATKQSARFDHLLALIGHRSADTRKDALQQLSGLLASGGGSRSLDTLSVAAVLRRVSPLACDDTRSVRSACLDLLTNLSISSSAWSAHLKPFLLHVDGAMTHISPSIRADSTKFLKIALDRTRTTTPPLAVTALPHLLDKFAKLLGWPTTPTHQTSPSASTTVLTHHLTVLHDLLETALTCEDGDTAVVPVMEITRWGVTRSGVGVGLFCCGVRSRAYLKGRTPLDLWASHPASHADDDGDPISKYLPSVAPWLRARLVEASAMTGDAGTRALVVALLRVAHVVVAHTGAIAVEGWRELVNAITDDGVLADRLGEIAGATLIAREIEAAVTTRSRLS
ncbi:rRNA processing protein [Savitreella phatthalungensis]